jgi:hypothetical protein
MDRYQPFIDLGMVKSQNMSGVILTNKENTKHIRVFIPSSNAYFNVMTRFKYTSPLGENSAGSEQRFINIEDAINIVKQWKIAELIQ